LEDAREATISHYDHDDILVICMDANASILYENSFRSIDGAHKIIGPYEIPNIGKVGQRLQTFFNIHNLAALTSF